jgi:lipopolysaccharide/colanic/teichoic acid biosynthesis glycosyltransferase
MNDRIYMSSPDVGELEEQYVVAAIRSGWIAPLGPDVDAFERELAERVGVTHAVALSSGTAALHLGLLGLGVGPGDVVLTSTMTFAATANAIVYTGAEPYFIDCEFETGNMDPALLRQALEQLTAAGEHVAAIVPVDLLGKAVNYTEICVIAEEFGIPILMGVRGDAARMVGEAGAGVVFEPEDAEGLVEAVRTLLNLTADQRAAMDRAGRNYYQDKLSLEVGARRFGKILENASWLRPRSLAVKRFFDVIVSAIALLLLAIPMACVAIIVRCGLGNPVLFKQRRPGRDDVPFTLLKFRTMTDKRRHDGELLPDKDRLTPLGSFLRASSLDELPELWNVPCGHMSLVGPRPLLLRYTKYFTEDERIRLRVRPGITGLAQVSGRNTASWNRRLALDVQYVRHRSLWLDLKILWLTVGKVFSGHGVVVDSESAMLNLDDEREKARQQ